LTEARVHSYKRSPPAACFITVWHFPEKQPSIQKNIEMKFQLFVAIVAAVAASSQADVSFSKEAVSSGRIQRLSERVSLLEVLANFHHQFLPEF
jgi:hypothetical protein